MAKTESLKSTKIFGDFQTPRDLSAQSVECIKHFLSFKPRSIIEPTCGIGAFLFDSVKTFPEASNYLGVEINTAYYNELTQQIQRSGARKKIQTINADFFSVDWDKIIASLPEPILITGNPPWVTNSNLGVLQATNLPAKNNFQDRQGLDAITGKANFDISEWMMLQYLEWLENKQGAVAVLCKTAVARKILHHAWKKNKPIGHSAMYMIDALSSFGAAVDACLFIVLAGKQGGYDCHIYDNLDSKQPSGHIGFKDNLMLSNIDAYAEFSFLNGSDAFYTWRSGIKHDCSRVMELDYEIGSLTNGLGQAVDIEDDYIYPLLKSSDLGNGRVKECRKKVIVTQRSVGENTANIQYSAPKAWAYLQSHYDALAARKSSIYRKRPPFSIFGVGEYSFSPWKVAISGLYKKLRFSVVAPMGDKPVVFDDTVYFISCQSKAETEFLSDILNSDEAHSYLESLIFWSNKRPITIDILKRLSIASLAKSLNRYDKYLKYTATYTRSKKAKAQDL